MYMIVQFFEPDKVTLVIGKVRKLIDQRRSFNFYLAVRADC